MDEIESIEKPNFILTTQKNIINFDILNFKEGKKYTVFLISNSSLNKIYEASTKTFSIVFNFGKEYMFGICENFTNGLSDISEIQKITTENEIYAMPYGKTNCWTFNKNLKDEIHGFDFESNDKKFQKFDYEYFLYSKKINNYTAINKKKFADYFSFSIKFNLVLYESGKDAKIISNCSEDNLFG